jgi:hypothetical protein
MEGSRRRREAPLVAGRQHMQPPLTIKKITLPTSVLQVLSADHRHTLLLLGLMLNEVNWLRKLLIKSTQEKPGEPESMASLSLTLLLLTTLAGKIFEGSEKLRQGKVGKALRSVNLPPSVQEARKQLHRLLGGNVLNRIRQIAFHYPDALDLPAFAPPDDAESVIYGSSVGGDGDFLSHLSTLAVVGPLVQLRPSTNWRVSLESVLNEVIEAAGHYSNLMIGATSMILSDLPPGTLCIEDIPNPDAATLLHHPLYFFASPPDDMPTGDDT